MRVDGVPAGEDAVGAATAIKDASLDGGKRAGDIFKGFCAAMSIKAIIAGFCAPLPAPLPIVALVAGLTSTQETRLTLDAC